MESFDGFLALSLLRTSTYARCDDGEWRRRICTQTCEIRRVANQQMTTLIEFETFVFEFKIKFRNRKIQTRKIARI